MSYAVTWSANGGPVFAGRLEVSSTSLNLIGIAPSARGSHEQVSFADVAETRMERRPERRLAGRPTLVVELRNGMQLRIATLSGAGLLNEVAQHVAEALGQDLDRTLAASG